MKKLPIIAFLLVGCAARKHGIVTATPVVIIPRECITKVELTPDSECYVDKDGHLTMCRHIMLVHAKECEALKLPEKEKR